MNKKELVELLSQYPDDMEVIIDCHSDYSIVCTIEIIKAVKQDCYVMSSHPTMSEENRSKEKEFIYLNWRDSNGN